MVSPSLDLDAGLPLRLAVQELGVTPATIKGWYARGRLTVVGHDKHLGRLYRYGDLITADRATATSPNRRTRTRDRDIADGTFHLGRPAEGDPT